MYGATQLLFSSSFSLFVLFSVCRGFSCFHTRVGRTLLFFFYDRWILGSLTCAQIGVLCRTSLEWGSDTNKSEQSVCLGRIEEKKTCVSSPCLNPTREPNPGSFEFEFRRSYHDRDTPTAVCLGWCPFQIKTTKWKMQGLRI